MFSIYKKIFKKNKFSLFNYNQNSFFEGTYRFFAIIISPLFTKLNPNLISVFSLLSSFVALVLSFYYDLKIVILFFLLSFVLDFVDGIVARYNNLTSFFGRFIDGLFDIIVLGLIHIILLLELSRNFNFDSKILLIYLFIILILPIQHLILDRYSALARWCNEIKKKNFIKPYVRNNYLNKITFMLFDLQHITLFSILIINEFYLKIFIDLFFLVSLINSSFVILLYLYLSKKNLSSVRNQNDNNEK